ncbi:MAG: fibronectin type III domain-containing protein [Paludibacteraceae bacterium]|nr:fibronectin type III domain-containing protein [Paludibacteraceae bacterium]
MKKIIFTLLSAIFALSAFAQLAVPFDYTQTNFNDGTVTVQKGTKGTISWSGGVKHTQGSLGFNWDDSYVVIAIDGLPDKLTFSTSTNGASTAKSLGDYWYASQSTSTSFSNNDKVWTSNKQTNSPTISLNQDTKYIKLCFSGNLEGTMKNIAVSKYTPVATAATALEANSFTANWDAAKGTNITYTLEVSDANGVVKNIENITGTSYTVEDLNPLTAYSYVVYVVANGNTTSDASNIIEVTTLPTPTTALDATDVTFNSFTANWEASDLEGAKYNVDVYDAEGTNIASASNIEENYFEVSNLDPESTYTYVAYVVIGEATSEASNAISVTTLSKPTITPVTNEYQLFSDTGIEGLTSVLITAVNVTEATATITGDAEFYFKDADGNPVTTKTVTIAAEGPTEFELFSYFTAGGDYNATVTISATDADNVTVSVTATATFVVPATEALEATDVTFNSFTANWEASDMEGATYTIEVKNSTDETIASASGLEKTSYAVSNLDPESTYTYVVYVTVSEVTSDASNSIEVTTLAKPTIILNSEELFISTDTDIEQSETIVVSTVNVEEVTATIAGDAGFYFEGGELTKTLTVNEDGSVEFNLLYKFTEEGDFNGTITFSATDAEDAHLSLYASASKPTDVPENTISGIVKSFNSGLLQLNNDYASIVVSNLAGKTVAQGKGHTIAVAQGQTYLVKLVDLEGNINTIKVK